MQVGDYLRADDSLALVTSETEQNDVRYVSICGVSGSYKNSQATATPQYLARCGWHVAGKLKT